MPRKKLVVRKECPELRNLKIVASLALICTFLAAVCHAFPLASAGVKSGPAVEISVGPLADNYADSMYPDKPYGKRTILYVGNSYDRPQNVSGPARIYIEFDLSAIPLRVHVVSAEMALYQMYAPGSSQTYEAHMVESAWNESTMSWKTQPTSSQAVVSTARVSTEKNLWVAWNVTSAVQAWVNGDARNYGFMIRIEDERSGVANEASGFYSREYPKQDQTPKLRVLCQNRPPFTFLVTAHVAGLPPELSSHIISDTNETITVRGGGVGYLLLESGDTHAISADEYVSGGNGIRYHATTNSIAANKDEELTVTYEAQFLVSVKSEPPGLVEREWSQWYDAGARIETPLAREVVEEQTDMELVFDGWYINDARQPGNSVEVIVDGPATVTARYTTLYNVTASSPYGKTSGSGWHPAGSSVEVSVTPTYLPADGALGYLGFGLAFDHWTGSFESASPTVTITADKPVHVRAVWREDWTWFVVGLGIAITLVLVLAIIHTRSKQHSKREIQSKTRKH